MLSNLSQAPILTPPPTLNSIGPTTSGAGSVVASADLSGSLSTSGTLMYPLDTPKYIMTFLIQKYVRQNLNTIGQFVPDANYPAIVLPLPQQLIDTNHVEWAQVEVGTLPGSIINSAFNNIPNKTGAAVAALAGAGTAGGVLGLAGAAGDVTGVGAGVSGAVTGVEAVLGVSPNQFMTMLMRGPTYKRHRFSWELSPTNFQEADSLRQIITTFKNAMSPNFMQITQGGGPVLWTFPHIFRIALYPNSMFMYKFKPCIMDYCTVNYSPGNRAAFNVNSNGIAGGNAPEGVQIQMNFVELEYFVEGNFGPNVGAGNNDPFATSSNNPAGTATNLLNVVSQSAVTDQLQINAGNITP